MNSIEEVEEAILKQRELIRETPENHKTYDACLQELNELLILRGRLC